MHQTLSLNWEDSLSWQKLQLRRKESPVGGLFLGDDDVLPSLVIFFIITQYSPIGITANQLTKTHEMDFVQNHSCRLKWTIILA